MKSLKMLLSFALFVSVGTMGFAQTNNDYNDWDADQNDQIDQNEFSSNYEDENFGNWDADEDDMLSEDEWNENATSYYEEDEGLFDTFDTNSDDYIDQDEYNQGTFDLWDENDDGSIDNEEYDAYNN